MLKTRRQCKEYFEVIPLHCDTNTLIRFAIRLMIPNHETLQIHQISGQQTKFSITIYSYMHLCIIISALLYQLLFLSMHKSLVYPPSVCIVYDECSEDVTGEYSSTKYQWRNRGGALGAIAPPWRGKLLFLKEYKNEIIHLVLPHLNFWFSIEKCYYVSISTGCQSFKYAKNHS